MESKAYRTYLEEEKAWLADYALYMAVKDSFDGKVGISGRKTSGCVSRKQLRHIRNN